MILKRILLALSCVSIAACVPVDELTPLYQPGASVTAEESLRIAESYRLHTWVGKAENVCHGLDVNGVRVDTPDESLKKGVAARKGWWRKDTVNRGIPYQWGGFDTPESFDKKLKEGFYAGDVYTSAKRKALLNGVSKQACGIDCSGFVSRCWKLDRAYSTRELPDICKRLSSFSELQPGDLVNRYNDHALLFERFLDDSKVEIVAYQTGSAPSWKVLRYKIPVADLKAMGYQPYRYLHMKP